jgi:hypothetical protein
MSVPETCSSELERARIAGAKPAGTKDGSALDEAPSPPRQKPSDDEPRVERVAVVLGGTFRLNAPLLLLSEAVA